MSNDQQIPIRLPTEIVERLDALVPLLASDPKLGAWRITRSAVMRQALLRGLDLLETEYKPRSRSR